MVDEKKKFYYSVAVPGLFVLLLWIIKIVEVVFKFDFVTFGVYPGKVFGLSGILTFPLVHANFSHLFSNTFPLLFLGAGLFYFYKESSVKVSLIIYFGTGILVWLFARPSFHIGASGIVYGLAAFIFFSGVIRRDRRAIALALLVTFLYGGLVWGVLPVDPKISWEGHLFGGLLGIFCALIFRKKDPYKPYDWDEEEFSADELP